MVVATPIRYAAMFVATGAHMTEVDLKLTTVIAIAATRALAGIGVGLLLAGKLNPAQRRPIGWGLVAVGVLSTVPLARRVLRNVR